LTRTATPTATNTPTATPTATPIPNCVFEGANLRYFRAPITGNPPKGQLNYSDTRNYVAEEYFVDHLDVVWYRIIRVELDGQPNINIDQTVADENGVWMRGDELGSAISGYGCENLLRLNTTYVISDHAWNTFDGTFDTWPLDVNDICSVDTSLTEFYSLGIGEASRYPRGTHTGVDLFVPNDSSNLPVRAIADGIVVGIGVGSDSVNTHAAWGSSTQLIGSTESSGFSVITRHGHLYTLYGHLSALANNVWVGADVSAGMQLGTLGVFGDRHLHMEVHSYGATVSQGIADPYSQLIDSTGILPTGVEARFIVAPYLYDPLQLFGNPPNYQASLNEGLSFKDALATSRLLLAENQASLNIALNANCSREYKTVAPTQSEVIVQEGVYRGFVEYQEYSRSLPSPLTQTSSP
jgi:hypothetical protein